MNELSRRIFSGQVDKSKPIEIDVEDEGLVLGIKLVSRRGRR